MSAAIGAHLEVVAALLAANAGTDLQNKKGSTALIYSASAGHAKVVHSLLAAGASTHLGRSGTNDSGVTASAATFDTLVLCIWEEPGAARDMVQLHESSRICRPSCRPPPKATCKWCRSC